MVCSLANFGCSTSQCLLELRVVSRLWGVKLCSHARPLCRVEVGEGQGGGGGQGADKHVGGKLEATCQPPTRCIGSSALQIMLALLPLSTACWSGYHNTALQRQCYCWSSLLCLLSDLCGKASCVFWVTCWWHCQFDSVFVCSLECSVPCPLLSSVLARTNAASATALTVSVFLHLFHISHMTHTVP